ncbi:hypothetical protein RB595_007910 [Gaeumannomyces hyphopodioides]
MPSVKNPNKPSKNRLAARAAKVRKTAQRKSAEGKLSRVERAATRRGARPGLLPTSGAGAPISAKKQRKLDRKLNHALKRKMEAEGEVEMKDIPEKKASATVAKAEADAKAADDMELDIS